MDKIEKLFRKLGTKERAQLLEIVDLLKQGKITGLKAVKLQGTDFYRIRHRRFRIIYHKERTSGDFVVDSIRFRREDTYRKI